MKALPKGLANNREVIDNFLEALRLSANVSASCEAAGMPRCTAYLWRSKYATFAAEWDDALEYATDMLEGEARKRAFDDSDRLLMFLLKAHRRDKFGDKVEVKSEGEIKIVFDNDWKKS